MEPRALARLAPARGRRATPASRRSCATSTAPTATSRRCGSVDFDAAGFYWIEPNDADANVVAFARALDGRERVLVCVVQPVAGRRARATALGLPRAGRWREALNTDAGLYGGSDVGQPRRRRGRADAVARPAVLGGDDAAAARRRSGSCPSDELEPHASGAPLGATRRRRTSRSACGRPAPTDGGRARRAARRHRAGARGLRHVGGDVPAGAGDDYGYVLDGDARCPTPARAGSREGLRGPSRVVDPARSLDRRRLDAAGAGRPRHLRAARRHVHAPRARSTAAIAQLARAGRAGRHRDRADAGGRVPGRAAAGATTASTCAPRSRPTAGPRRSQRLVDAAHAARPRR